MEAVDFAFEPREVAIDAGATVSWTNTGSEIHNVKGRAFFSGALGPGETFEQRFRKPGRYRFVCTLHPTTMRGVVEVR